MNVILLLAEALALGMPSGSYDCTVGQVQVIDLADGKASVQEVTAYPLSYRQFKIKFDGDSGEVAWPDSQIQVSGKIQVVPTGASSGMIFTFSGGPCSLTGNPCAAMVNFAKQCDGTLKLLIVPTAVTSADERDATRSPLLVALQGACTRGVAE
jgi:hypothetical protein